MVINMARTSSSLSKVCPFIVKDPVAPAPDISLHSSLSEANKPASSRISNSRDPTRPDSLLTNSSRAAMVPPAPAMTSILACTRSSAFLVLVASAFCSLMWFERRRSWAAIEDVAFLAML